MKHLFIINPFSGKGEYKRVAQILQRMKETNKDIIIENTQYQGHEKAIIEKYSRVQELRIYSVGGDGTTNEILNGIFREQMNENVEMGIIPCGSGNDYIKNFTDITHTSKVKNLEEYLHSMMKAPCIGVDVGVLEGDYFLNIFSIGFDAEVVKNSLSFKKKSFLPSQISYFTSALYTLAGLKAYDCKIVVDDKKVFENFMMASIGNGRYYGGGMKVLPRADVSDGLFDICIVEEISKTRFVALIKKFITGQHEHVPEVTMLQGKKIKVIPGRQMYYQFDGELHKGKNIEIHLIRNGLKLIKPL